MCPEEIQVPNHKENMVTVSKRLVLMSRYLRHVEVSLLQELADDEDVRGGSISCDVILRRGNLCDERGCRVLNLLRTTRKKKDFANSSFKEQDFSDNTHSANISIKLQLCFI